MADAAAASVESACTAFLAATSPHERTAAENFLLEFRRHPQPLPICRHLLVHSAVGYAKLQALCTVRECLGAQWAGLAPAERAELQTLLQQQAVAPVAAAERYVSEAAAQVLAVHAKHDLLQAEGGGASAAAIDGLLSGSAQMLDDPSGAHAEAALRVLSALLTEFGAPSTGTVGGGLPWSMHARAGSLRGDISRAALRLGTQFLLRAAGGGQPLALTRCASLLSNALSWEFGA